MRQQRTTRHRAAAIWVMCGACAIGRMPEKLERRRVLRFIGSMKTLISLSALILLAACASHTPYGPAKSSGAAGYETQKIETNRYRVSYTDRDAGRSHDMALLRAAEITQLDGRDWFEITGGYTDQDGARSDSRNSVSVGGSTGSRGRSGVGVGVGFGIPVSSSGGSVTTVIDIVTGENPKPDRPSVYDAMSVDINLRGNAP
ncbi:MAG: hypothetical protein ACI9NG_002677 [Hyphomonas sp.]|jgi:hypothetical protein